MNKALEEFLAKVPGGHRCKVCAASEVDAIIVAHLDKLAAHETVITLRYIHQNLLVPNYPDAPSAADTIRNHVRRCLNRDPKTGKAL